MRDQTYTHDFKYYFKTNLLMSIFTICPMDYKESFGTLEIYNEYFRRKPDMKTRDHLFALSCTFLDIAKHDNYKMTTRCTLISNANTLLKEALHIEYSYFMKNLSDDYINDKLTAAKEMEKKYDCNLWEYDNHENEQK